MLAWQNRPQKLVAKYIKKSLSNYSSPNISPQRKTVDPPRNTGKLSVPINICSPEKMIPPPASPTPMFRVRTSSGSSESSMVEIESYEDELKSAKKFTLKNEGSGSRVRIESMSQITGVRFDANPEH